MLQIRQDRQLRQRMPLTSSPCATPRHFLICREQTQRASSRITSTQYKWLSLVPIDIFLIDPYTRVNHLSPLLLSSELFHAAQPKWYTPRPLCSHGLPSQFKPLAATAQRLKAYSTPYSALIEEELTPFIDLLNWEHVKC